MKLKLSKPLEQGVITFEDNQLKVKCDSGETITIHPLSLDLKGVKVVYSLPNNNKHKCWTKKRVEFKRSINDLSVINNFWSKYKKGDKVKGIIDSNNLFIITK